MQPGLFDWQNRFEKLNTNGDPLVKLNKVIQGEALEKPWKRFAPGEKRTMQEQSPMMLC